MMVSVLTSRSRILARLRGAVLAVACAAAALAVATPPAQAVADPCLGRSWATSGSAKVVSSILDLYCIGTGTAATNGSYVQTADISMADLPAGVPWRPVPTFTGSYDGGGYTIAVGFTATAAGNNIGVFSRVNGPGRIANVRLTSVAAAPAFTIDAQGSQVGALVGWAQNGATVTGIEATGIRVRSTGSYVGGIVGLLRGAALSNVDVDGLWVEGAGDMIGGIVGLADGFLTLDSSIASVTVTSTATVSGREKTGALAGATDGRTALPISDISMRDVVVTGSWDKVGGLIGNANASTLTAVRMGDATVTGASSRFKTGGFVGELTRSASPVIDALGTVTVTGGWEVGGLYGRLEDTNMDGMLASGTVTGETAVGGIVGMLENYRTEGSQLTASSFTGTVTGLVSVGGVVGLAQRSGSVAASRSVVRDVVARGSVVARSVAGSPVSSIGGVIGTLGAGATLARAYASAPVTRAAGLAPGAGTAIGSAIGTVNAGAVIETPVFGLASPAAGAPSLQPANAQAVTSTQLRDIAFVGAAWNGPDVVVVDGWRSPSQRSNGQPMWGMCDGMSDGYPYLQFSFTSSGCIVPAPPAAASAPSPSGQSDGRTAAEVAPAASGPATSAAGVTVVARPDCDRRLRPVAPSVLYDPSTTCAGTPLAGARYMRWPVRPAMGQAARVPRLVREPATIVARGLRPGERVSMSVKVRGRYHPIASLQASPTGRAILPRLAMTRSGIYTVALVRSGSTAYLKLRVQAARAPVHGPARR